MNMRTTLSILILGLVSFFPTGIHASMSEDRASIRIEQTLHVLGVDGSNALVTPGTYSVEAAETWLRLVPGQRRDAMLIEAESVEHKKTITEPTVSVTTLDGDQQEIILLLPDGTGLKARGSYSGVRSRGLDRAQKRSRLALRRPSKSTDKFKSKTQNQKPTGSGKTKLKPGFLSPEDPWDKMALIIIQGLQKKVKQLEKEVSNLKKKYATHQHDYEDRAPSGNAWVTIRQLRKMKDDESHPYDKFGLYFKSKPKVAVLNKETGNPK